MEGQCDMIKCFSEGATGHLLLSDWVLEPQGIRVGATSEHWTCYSVDFSLPLAPDLIIFGKKIYHQRIRHPTGWAQSWK